MKILHISDLHVGPYNPNLDNLETVRDFCVDRKNGLDVVVCSGDLMDRCLTKEQIEQMAKAYNFLTSNVGSKEDISFEELLDQLKKADLSGLPEELRKGLRAASRDYKEVEQEFDRHANNEYRRIFKIFRQLPQQVVVCPGNWDSTNFFDYAEDMNIHRTIRDINGLRFAGYGDSKDMAPMPPTRTIGFSDKSLFGFLRSVDPDVAITHVPPYEEVREELIGDKVKRKKIYRGNFAARAFLESERPILYLCGHHHDDRGFYLVNPGKAETLVNNAGNLGSYEHSNKDGTFTEVELDEDKRIVSATPYRIMDGKVKTAQARTGYDLRNLKQAEANAPK